MQESYSIIGDVHGCISELEELLASLPARPVVFLGDLMDRGPDSRSVVGLVAAMVGRGDALMVQGNHEAKFVRAARGKGLPPSGYLLDTLSQFTPRDLEAAADFLERQPTQLVLDEGRLVVAHAGLREDLHGVQNKKARDFALYGDTSSGDVDAYGMRVRGDWASEYRGKAWVVCGHYAVREAVAVNRTICVDTGCVYGNKLTAILYPEMEIVSVPARREYVRRAQWE